MKQNLLLLIAVAVLLFAAINCRAQTNHPKQHTYYDTVITKKTDFLPDTIPVYYLELIVPENGNQEQPYQLWRVGFVIWNTYKKSTLSNFGFDFTGTLTYGGVISTPNFIIDEYEFTQNMPGVFIDNKKQRVPKGNKVLKAFKR